MIRRKRNFKNLALDEAATESVPLGGSAHQHLVPIARGQPAPTSAAPGVRNESMPTLELGVEFKLDLRSEDLQTLEELGAGNGGTVSRVIHLPTKAIMARK
ncbi:MAP kinase kinase (MEK), partial [Lunasporangiospora selenospora]